MSERVHRPTKEYLGDSVYVDVDIGGGAVLTTENGLGASNQIVLEPEVLKRFEEWLAERVATRPGFRSRSRGRPRRGGSLR